MDNQLPTDASQLDPKVLKVVRTLRDIESGGDYNAVGDGGESHGAYQFNKGNFKSWAKQYLGDENAPMTPANQNKLMYLRVKEQKDAGLQPEEIAAIHNGAYKDENGKYQYNQPSYGVKFRKALLGEQTPIQTDTTQPKFYGAQTDTNKDQGFLGDLAKGDFKGAGMNALKGGEGLLNKISSPFAGLAAIPVQALAKTMGKPDPFAEGIGTDISGTPGTGIGVSKLDVGSKTKDLVNAGLETGAVASAPGLLNKVFGSTLIPEVATQLTAKTGIPLKVYNTLSKTEKLNALGEALKGAQAGDAINITKAMTKLNPSSSFLKNLIKTGIGIASYETLKRVFGDKIGGVIHGVTGL